MEKPVDFQSGKQCLRGILHTPEKSGHNRTGIVFVNAGLVCRAGPERLYVKAARRLSGTGYSCLRFDLPGVGNSSGDFGRISIDLFSDTSCTQRAIDFLIKETGIQDVILIGMCTGARHAVWAARKDSRIRSLVLLSMPITFDRTKTPLYNMRRSRRNLQGTSRNSSVKERLKSTQLGIIARRMWSSSKPIRYSMYKYVSNTTRVLSSFLSGQRIDPTIREGLHRSCQQLLRDGRKLYFFYGNNDTVLVQDFRTHLQSQSDVIASDKCPPFDFWFVESAGHVYSGIALQNAVIDEIAKWIGKQNSVQ